MIIKPPSFCKVPKGRSLTVYSSTSTLVSPSPVQPVSPINVLDKSSFDPTDALAHCYAIFSALKDVAGNTNLTPLRAVSSVICFIIETVQNVRSLVQQSWDLAEKVSRFSLAIAQELSEGDVTPKMIMQIGKLATILDDISHSLSKIQKYSWLRVIWKQASTAAKLSDLSSQLDECCTIFNLKAQVDINRLLTGLTQTVIARTDEILHRHDRLESTVERLVQQNDSAMALTQAMPVDGDIKYFNKQDLRLVKTIRQRPSKPALYQAEYGAGGTVVKAIVKIYHRPSTKSKNPFENEIKYIKGFWHPHLPQLLGRSVPTAKLPFLVLSDYTERNVRSDLEPKILKDPVCGFMAALEVLEGVASAIHYLRDQPGVGIAALNACCQVSTFRLGPSGQVLLGHGLDYSEPWTEDTGISVVPDNMLIHHYFLVMMELLYGDENAIDWGNWNSIQTTAPHVRPFLTFASYDCPSFNCLSERLTGLLRSLEPRLLDGTLDYPQIRAAMSAIPGIELGYFIFPPTPLDVALGDIGYIKGDTFFKLHNIQDDIPFDPAPFPGYFRASGDFKTEQLANGDIMHTFNSPVFIQILYRDRSEMCPSTLPALPYLIQNARSIYDKFCVDPDVDVTELILITELYYDRRFATYEAQVKPEHVGDPLPDVRLIEHKDRMPGQTWAEWVSESSVHGSVTVLQSQPQRICFFQLENGEC
ncbi:hypothetical protein FRB94_012265 [Tulasnella sp. JGI-2019a]|nr:hypothetical protein FRB93_008938 [Tulasnella sp. JGI-2019a]KAG9009318.1 hypothetical protein FRB94_012265 [Tulasnella sp. JGI-2019a]